MTTYFPDSELILNADGSVFHLHLLPEQLAPIVLLVGDPGRVDRIASRFSQVECRVANREFVTATGTYKDKRISVVGTGIGTDNIDIVLNELDALANIDLHTRTEKTNPTSLTLVRIGTCGGLQEDLPAGTFLVSEQSIGFDGLLHFYANREAVCDAALEKAFCAHTAWPSTANPPYAVTANHDLVERIAQNDMKRGITLSANGFYGPQGRALRLPLALPQLNQQLETFRHQGKRITNYEMESSAVAGLSALLGHKAMTVCLVIANRKAKAANVNYADAMDRLIDTVLDRL
jgi:uridine phosphorylase